jgi:hypothetical protein
VLIDVIAVMALPAAEMETDTPLAVPAGAAPGATLDDCGPGVTGVTPPTDEMLTIPRVPNFVWAGGSKIRTIEEIRYKPLLYIDIIYQKMEAWR